MAKIISEIRKDYLREKFVLITPGRNARPRDMKEQTIIKRVSDCFFCPDSIKKQQKLFNNKYIADEIKVNGKWQVLSVKNVFPAVSLDNPKAFGTQEVIIETPHHSKDLSNLDIKQIENVLRMYAKRTLALEKIKNINYILCFKNQGSKAGASITHAHSQVFATKIIPPELQHEATCLNNYYNSYGTCAYCDIIKKEMKSTRKIFENKYIAAFTPFASEYHYEAWIFPKRHLDNITQLNQAEINSFAKTLKFILTKLNSINLSFNYFLHNVTTDDNQHFYIKIQPRDSVWAGVELGSGLVINSVPPEEAASFYKK